MNKFNLDKNGYWTKFHFYKFVLSHQFLCICMLCSENKRLRFERALDLPKILLVSNGARMYVLYT